MAKPIAKITLLREAAARQDWTRALSIAVKFPQLGAHKAAITRARDAIQNPGFYEQLGQDPEVLVQIGITALQNRYQL